MTNHQVLSYAIKSALSCYLRVVEFGLQLFVIYSVYSNRIHLFILKFFADLGYDEQAEVFREQERLMEGLYC